MTPRATIVWLFPVAFSLMLGALAVFVCLAPEGVYGTDPANIVVLTGAIVLVGQGIFLGLTERWVRSRS